ncbi:hypothetical protein BU24DRAFT_480072 [Aaosphaeria arxii CBS 175.79]|uniref:Uncharacterized protein n=1 Tax=Aaosphaeria arxii CBS 175.79 TaxID=1450172 RepID=A0A6A5XQQ1_9PLEO|nr:uncharacterized protein BU24DRAFT_480072 [Aaosphaeria arxii CBS 175.79]KAF2015263.1 hypothetical protein BU24DRAFT_480072 [Aaosphaeria arxii CBS 175.79]
MSRLYQPIVWLPWGCAQSLCCDQNSGLCLPQRALASLHPTPPPPFINSIQLWKALCGLRLFQFARLSFTSHAAASASTPRAPITQKCEEKHTLETRMELNAISELLRRIASDSDMLDFYKEEFDSDLEDLSHYNGIFKELAAIAADSVVEKPPVDWAAEREYRYLAKALELVEYLMVQSSCPFSEAAKLFKNASRVRRQFQQGFLVKYLSGLPKNSTKPVSLFVEEAFRTGRDSLFFTTVALIKFGLIGINNSDEQVAVYRNVLKASILPSAAEERRKKQRQPEDHHHGHFDLTEYLARGWRTPVVETYAVLFIREDGGLFESVSALQACVWGGKIESFTLPGPAKKHALIKFSRIEACQKYLNDAQDGVYINGVKIGRAVPYYPYQLEHGDMPPNLGGFASRCVRALEVDKSVSREAISTAIRDARKEESRFDKFAYGADAGRRYYEFRFSSIQYASDFMDELRQNKDWARCKLELGIDPCEKAYGVHLNDDRPKPKEPWEDLTDGF